MSPGHVFRTKIHPAQLFAKLVLIYGSQVLTNKANPMIWHLMSARVFCRATIPDGGSMQANHRSRAGNALRSGEICQVFVKMSVS